MCGLSWTSQEHDTWVTIRDEENLENGHVTKSAPMPSADLGVKIKLQVNAEYGYSYTNSTVHATSPSFTMGSTAMNEK